MSLFATGCVSTRPPNSYYHPEFTKQDPISLSEKVREMEQQDFDNIRLETLAVNELSSHHLVVIRKAEPLHQHVVHDGWAVVLRGKGEFVLGERRFSIQPGASVYIPRGVPHKAICFGKEPIAAFVIFTPPYDGRDTVPLPE